MGRTHLGRVAWLIAVVAGAGAAPVLGQTVGEWPSYASDKASTKYSPLSQINADNVNDLVIVWRWKSADYELAKTESAVRATGLFETTPIMVNGLLYSSTAAGQAVAIDPKTGETFWAYNPYDLEEGEEKPKSAGIPITRGLGYWTDGTDRRLLTVSNQHLVSVDAKTGKLDPNFGVTGKVDMRLGVDPPFPWYAWTSPPIVCNDVIIMGNSTMDQQVTKESTPGRVRGYDVRTGELLWVFNIVPKKGEFGYETWENGSAEYTGHGNVWTWISVDEELGYVYLPTSTPNNDWYGGHRHGDTLFAESLVCLDAKTGKRVWHFQAVHHGLWDYDFPCAPILCDITVGGKDIKAVVQLSKQAFAYVFDRVTGKPVWPIEERSVPASDVPGERAAATQPHPNRPAPYDLQGLTEDDLIDFTPELRAKAVALLAEYRIGPLFNPPSVIGAEEGTTKGTIQSPGPVGGSNWNGAAFDPVEKILYVPSVSAPIVASLIKPAGGRSNLNYVRGSGRGSLMFLHMEGLPIVKPPYGRITAIDMNTGDHLWVVPNGEGPRDHPLLKGLDLPRLGQPGRAGPLLTKTLLFLGEGSPGMIAVPPSGGGKMFRAYDKANGDVLWEIELEAGTTGTPMTYLLDGRQYVVVPIGSGSTPGQLVALALP